MTRVVEVWPSISTAIGIRSLRGTFSPNDFGPIATPSVALTPGELISGGCREIAGLLKEKVGLSSRVPRRSATFCLPCGN